MKFSKEEKKLLLEIIGDYQLNMLIKFCKKTSRKRIFKIGYEVPRFRKIKSEN